jgi:predicted small lipoprotein YifL
MMLRSTLLVSIAVGTLAGCGLKGSLYLPEQKGQEVPSNGDEQQRKERTRDSGAPVPATPTDTTGSPTSPPPGN